MKMLSRSAVVALLTLPLAAQEAAVTKASGPILTVKTADMQALMMTGMLLGAMQQPPPPLGEGQHYVLRLAADRTASVGWADGEVRWLEVSADPAGLMAAYAQEVKRGKGMAIGAARMLGSQNVDFMQVFEDLFAFPQQVDELRLVVPQKPEDDGPTAGFSVRLALKPAANSKFAAMMTQLKPAAGAPVLARADTIIEGRYSVDPAGLQAVFGLFTDWTMPAMFPDEDDRTKFAPLWQRIVESYGSSGVFTFGDAFQMTGLMDMKGAAEIMAHPDYVAMMERQSAMYRDQEFEFEANALEHRGTKMHRATIYNDGPPNPMFPDDELVSLSGAVGGYMVVASGDQNAKGLIDQVLDGKIDRKALSKGTLMKVEMSLRKMSQLSGAPVPDDLPEGMVIALGAVKGELTLALRFR